jgi:uncharacterized protein (TIGR02646 family)
MRYLVRPQLNPDCLANYDYTHDTWRSTAENGFPQIPSEEDRKLIWENLNAMQDNVCAYCEGGLEAGSHIEHFAKRSSNREKTFDWTNLFGSCNNADCCGHYKDSCRNRFSNYSLEELIKPDVDDPWDFLVFGSDGRVSVREELSPQDRTKGQKTIDVFNLNASFHIQERVAKYFLISNVLLVIEDICGNEDISPYVELVLEELRGMLPYLNTYYSAFQQHLPPEIIESLRANP